MKATEIIRNLLDLIDSVDSAESNTEINDYEDETSCGCGPDCDCPKCQEKLSNSPDELYVDTDTILSIGNDVHKPKHPADIRVSSVALYPDTAYKG